MRGEDDPSNSGLVMRDVSHGGHELGRAYLPDVPAVATLAELLELRIRSDVARYNTAPGPVFECLVQPADSIRHSDGHRMQRPRRLDPDQLVRAAEEAVAAGILWFVVGEERITDLTRSIEVEAQEEITAVLRRPVVAEVW